VGVANFVLGQSISIDETNTFQLKFVSSMKIVGAGQEAQESAFQIPID